jgi:serine/threonine protein kinase
MSSLTAYFIFRSAVGQLKNDYYQQGFTATQKLAAGIGTSLLEKDVLALNVTVGEIANSEGLIFAAIVDHKDRIVAHTDPEMINAPFNSIRNSRHIGSVETVAIEEGFSLNRRITSFSSDVTYAGTKIGKVYFALSPIHLYNSIDKYKRLFISFVVLSILLLSAILVAMDRAFLARTLKRQKELEGITQIGPYELRKRLALGGMAELFLADYVREDDFRKTVAVKRVLPHLAESPVFTKMFIREARLAALLQHPNIIQITDFGKIQDIYFIAMEYIYGKNLTEVMTAVKKGLAVDLAVFIATKISLGLQYAHSKKEEESGKPLGLVHRDISPENILISFQGEVKISDFGISKSSFDPGLTGTGVIKGKFSYLSPEQALGQEVDHQTDIFAFGIVFYEILSGRRLYKFANDLEAVRSIPEKEIVAIQELRSDIPDELNNIVMKCLEKDKKLRYQSAQEVHIDLAALRQSLDITYDMSDLSEFMNKHFGEENNATEL